MNEKNEKYPQLILGTDGVYEIFISEGVKLQFDTEDGLDEYIKGHEFKIKSIKADRIYEERNADYQTLIEILKAI